MIRARGLGFHYASRPRPAFQGIDLEVSRGEKVLITGDSGAGKSTLLAVLAGLYRDSDDGTRTGELTVDGTVGMVLQDPDSQVIASRVGDDVAFGCENLRVPRAEIWPRVRRALDAVGLHVPLDHPTAQLSGGQKQRLALAGVLAMGADIVILDEPTANLDPDGARDIIAAVEATCDTLIVVEHNPKPWLGLIDTIYHLRNDGMERITPADLPGPPDLPPATPASGASAITADSFSIPLAASTVVTGPNGAGKTTLALTLAGLRASDVPLHYADQIRRGLGPDPYRWRSAELAARIGFVFQDPEHQFVARTVREELAVSGAPGGRREAIAESLRLTPLLDANPYTLSGGEKRRLSVATALVNAPELVILDEPTFGQDRHTYVELVLLIRALADAGHTVVSVTHDPVFIASLGDHEVKL